ncbi:MAG TPA: hypothetical protein VLE51_03845 [Candidatus Saccharimonadales bacterium]|nr:hypothetical protein [Candidatus Saccharimonadales bacterium]HSX27511.1 hypothetical protein [Patescibacteria group bacterium]
MAKSKQPNKVTTATKFNKKSLLLFGAAFAVIGVWLIFKSSAATIDKMIILDYGSVAGIGTDPKVTNNPDIDGIPFVSNNPQINQPPIVTYVEPGGQALYLTGGKLGTPKQTCFIVKVPAQGKISVPTTVNFVAGTNSKKLTLSPDDSAPARYTPVCLMGKGTGDTTVSVLSGYLVNIYQVQIYY